MWTANAESIGARAENLSQLFLLRKERRKSFQARARKKGMDRNIELELLENEKLQEAVMTLHKYCNEKHCYCCPFRSDAVLHGCLLAEAPSEWYENFKEDRKFRERKEQERRTERERGWY